MHMSCARSVRDLVRNQVECFGNVYIRRPQQQLKADYVRLNLNTEQLYAEGNVVFNTPDHVLRGSIMDFNFQTEMGVIQNGTVENEKYQLSGERIERLGKKRYFALEGEYTTCRDCPASWKIFGKEVDLTIDEYAHMKQVYFKINEAPSLYLPYLVVPIKTKRQSGFLFPRLQLRGPNGFSFVQPYFWAISRSMDATFGLGYLSMRGMKSENEFRYKFSERTYGQFNGFYLNDKSFIESHFDRWALQYEHLWELPFDFEQRIRYADAGDRDYPRKIGDVRGRAEPGIISDASLSRSGNEWAFWVEAKRTRNTLTTSMLNFDDKTVQILPSVNLATNDHLFFESVPLRWGFQGSYARFYRLGPSFDGIYSETEALESETHALIPGKTPLRKGHRFHYRPEVYLPLKWNDALEITPLAQWRGFRYLFDNPQIAQPTTRGYLLAQTEVATTFEKIYSEKVLHKMRPSLTYSNIPIVREDPLHPFVKQVRTPGYQFDDFDIVPISYDNQLYFVPLGNSLSYRLSNKFILKSEDENEQASYRKVVDLFLGQSLNFMEYKRTDRQPEPFSRAEALLRVDATRIQGSGDVYYYPYSGGFTYNLGFKYIFSKHTKRLLDFERSLQLNYNQNHVLAQIKTLGGELKWSFTDTVAVVGGMNYSFAIETNGKKVPSRVLESHVGFTYQSPSQCYRVVLLASRSVDNPTIALNFNIPINLTGDGFMSLPTSGEAIGAAQASTP